MFSFPQSSLVLVLLIAIARKSPPMTSNDKLHITGGEFVLYNGWELFFKPARLQWGGPETRREPSLSVRLRSPSRLDPEWTDSVSACLVRLLKLSHCAVANVDDASFSTNKIAESLCPTYGQTDARVVFQDCKSKQEARQKHFVFVKCSYFLWLKL